MVSYGRMGMNFSLFFNDVIFCLNLYDKVSEVYHSVANSFFLGYSGMFLFILTLISTGKLTQTKNEKVR